MHGFINLKTRNTLSWNLTSCNLVEFYRASETPTAFTYMIKYVPIIEIYWSFRGKSAPVFIAQTFASLYETEYRIIVENSPVCNHQYRTPNLALYRVLRKGFPLYWCIVLTSMGEKIPDNICSLLAEILVLFLLALQQMKCTVPAHLSTIFSSSSQEFMYLYTYFSSRCA